MLFQKIKSLNGGTSITLNTNLLLIFWLCNIKKLNFRHFNTNSKKFTVTVVFFFSERNKTAPEKPILFCLVFQGVFGYLSEDYRRCRKAVQDVQRQQNIYEEKSDNFPRARKNYQCSIYLFIHLFIYLFMYFSRKTLQTLTVVSPETAIIKKLTNLTANSWATNTKH